jgi:hypothetical protein
MSGLSPLGQQSSISVTTESVVSEMAQKGRVPGSGKNYKYGKPMLNERLPKGKNAVAKVRGAEGPKKSSPKKKTTVSKRVYRRLSEKG